MALAAKVYEAFRDDTEKAKVLSDVIGELEVRISPLKDVATKGDIEVTRLTLQKEIEQVRGEIAEVRLSLQKEIEQVRLTLQKEIEQVRGEIAEVKLTLQKEIEQVKANIIKWVAGLLIIQTGVIVSIITLFK